MLFVTLAPLLIVALLPSISYFMKLKDEYDFKQKFKNNLEFMQLNEGDELMQGEEEDDETMLKYREVFVYFEKAGEGAFSCDEFIIIMKQLNFEEKAIRKIIEGDMNQSDGEINFGEFVKLINSKVHFGTDNDMIDKVSKQIEERTHLQRRNFCVNVVLVLSFLVLVSTSTTLFHYFKCHNFSDSNESYLYLDYSISCHSQRYKSFSLYAFLMIFIYPIGSKYLCLL